MTSSPTRTRAGERATRTGRLAALGRAAAGAAVMAIALGAGTAVGDVVTDRTGLGGYGARLLPAVLVAVIAIGGVLVLRRRWNRGWTPGLGLAGGTGRTPGWRAFLLGVAVTLGSAAVVLGAGTAAGWLRWGRLDPGALAAFVVTNGVVALLLEAFPEELTLRGHAWSQLRARYRSVAAALLTTLLFLLMPAGSDVVHCGVSLALGAGATKIGLSPAGQDPVSYLVLLTVFGLTLVVARTATRSMSLWTCIGTHLTFLTVNRIVLYGADHVGWSVHLTTPDAVVLLPLYLVPAAAGYGLLARRRRHRTNPPPE